MKYFKWVNINLGEFIIEISFMDFLKILYFKLVSNIRTIFFESSDKFMIFFLLLIMSPDFYNKFVIKVMLIFYNRGIKEVNIIIFYL